MGAVFFLLYLASQTNGMFRDCLCEKNHLPRSSTLRLSEPKHLTSREIASNQMIQSLYIQY